MTKRRPKVLVVDIGGSHVKLRATSQGTARKFTWLPPMSTTRWSRGFTGSPADGSTTW